MTRRIVYATPENEGEYADTPCEYVLGEGKRMIATCRVPLRIHRSTEKNGTHDWRIYLDDTTPTALGIADAIEFATTAPLPSDAGGDERQADRPRTSTWIISQTQLPDPGVEVLVAHVDGVRCVAQLTADGSKWWCHACGCGGVSALLTVTHWMPLPELSPFHGEARHP